MRRRCVHFLSSLLLAVAAPGCSEGPPPNILLVSVDTLRADALGAYGGPVPTPAFDRLARGGVLFESAIAPAPETAPSHATLFTGRDVRAHGVVRNGIELPAGVATLAEALSGAGYATAAFVSSFVLDPRFGLLRGFDEIDAGFPKEGETLSTRVGFAAQHRFEGYDRRAADTNRAVLPWLERAPEPFFLFVHYFDPHAPYGAPRALAQQVPQDAVQRSAEERLAAARAGVRGLTLRSLQRILRHYQAEVLDVDARIDALLVALNARGLRQRTLVVVTADHGEGLGQHGTLDHAPHLYEEQVRVPLVFQWPRRLAAGARLRAPVGLVDVAPTLAELAGVPLPGADGRSLAASLQDGSEPARRPLVGRRRLYTEPVGPHRGSKFFVRTDRWKYIQASADPDELYDLGVDPTEEKNVLAAHLDTAGRLRRVLDAHRALHPAPNEAPPVAEEVRRGLEALGYAE